MLVGRYTALLALLDAGCPIGRHELTDEQWTILGMLRAERERLTAEETAERGKRNNPNAPY